MRLKEAQTLGILALIVVVVILLIMWGGEEQVAQTAMPEQETAVAVGEQAEPDWDALVQGLTRYAVQTAMEINEGDERGTMELSGHQLEEAAPTEEETLSDMIRKLPPEDIPLRPAAPAAKEEERPAPPPKKIVHVVQKGDTLSGISEKYYGTSSKWRGILEANKVVLRDPKMLRPGTRLSIPALTRVADAQRPILATNNTRADPARRTYTVKKGDTLYGIAKRCYDDGSRWRRILGANRHQLSDPRQLRTGMKLVLP